MQQMSADEQYDKLASDMEVHLKQIYEIEFLHVAKTALTDIHRHLMNTEGGGGYI